MSIPEVYSLVLELAHKAGAPMPLKSVPGCWSHRIEHGGGVWWFAINGHDKPQRFDPPETSECMGLEVPPYNVAVICNGWIAGLVDAGGGGLIGTDEADVIAALKSGLELLAVPA